MASHIRNCAVLRSSISVDLRGRQGGALDSATQNGSAVLGGPFWVADDATNSGSPSCGPSRGHPNGELRQTAPERRNKPSF